MIAFWISTIPRRRESSKRSIQNIIGRYYYIQILLFFVANVYISRFIFRDDIENEKQQAFNNAKGQYQLSKVIDSVFSSILQTDNNDMELSSQNNNSTSNSNNNKNSRKKKRKERIVSSHPSSILYSFKHPQLTYPETNENIELDIYIPSFQLAFEYQGKQHYHDHYLFGSSSKRKTMVRRILLSMYIRENPYLLLIYESPLSFIVGWRKAITM